MATSKIKIPVLLSTALFMSTLTFAQGNIEKDKIAASQTGASPIYFETSSVSIPSISPGNFNNEQECQTRAGLPNFFAKINSGKEVTVAFIGGSITQANLGYRLQTANDLEHQYPKTKFKWINAGVSGTGTELGAFRIGEHVLQHRPDLIFMEFAVNGAYAEGMEGMIRQAIKRNPDVDICLIYTISNGQTAFYQKGEIPPNIIGLEQVAAHYNLPAIHLGIEAAYLESTGKLLWKGEAQTADPNRILFSEDGIHPTTAGGNLYAAAITRSFSKIEKAKPQKKNGLPSSRFSTAWEKATMVELSTLPITQQGWKLMETASDPNLKKFSPWFTNVLTASKPGASFSFRFKGDLIGVFDIGGPEVGQLEWLIDGKPIKLERQKQGSFSYYQSADAPKADALNRFNAYCNNRYRGQFDVIKLPDGEHLVTIILAAQKANKLEILPQDKRADILNNPEKYDQTVVYLGRILWRGERVK